MNWKNKFGHVFGKNADFGKLVQHIPYTLIFKTTNYCCYKCPHCCENSGPDQEKNLIPETVIRDYLTQALKDPQFDKNLIFTGGEIFSAYEFYDKQYVPNLLQFALDNNISTDIKTNAGWISNPGYKDIIKDLKHLVSMDVKRRENGISHLQISLSVDKFHPNCFDNNIKLIKKLAGFPLSISVSCFDDQQDILQEFNKQLSQTVSVSNGLLVHPDQTSDKIKLINDRTIYLTSCAKLFSAGRATSIPGAYKTELPQFTFLCPENYHILTAFDSYGNVTLGENSGRKISTPWIDKDKNPKPLAQIHQELVKNTRKEDLRYNLYGRFFTPIR